MNRIHRLTIAGIVLACGFAASSARAANPAVLNIDSLLSVYLLGDTQDMRTDKIDDDSLSSVHLTQIRDGVQEQRHLNHQETVWVVRGAVRLTLDADKYKVAAGTVVTIPPGVSHSFYSMGKIPAVIISVFSPGFDGKDRVYENSKGH